MKRALKLMGAFLFLAAAGFCGLVFCAEGGMDLTRRLDYFEDCVFECINIAERRSDAATAAIVGVPVGG